MALQVALVPDCCGAKILYGFPSGQIIGDPEQFDYDHGAGKADYYTKYNERLALRLKEDIQALFDKPYYACLGSAQYMYWVNEKERKHRDSTPIDKNAFVLAITNDKQDHICRPVLESFGFVQTSARKNPNSGNMVYMYLLTPNW